MRDRQLPRSRPYHPPLPGTGVPPRGLFVSRWGALLTRPAKRELPSFDERLFSPGARELLFRVQQKSWNIYLIGNEDTIARGKAGDEAWDAFETALVHHLESAGIPLTRNYACLDHPDGKGKHKRDSVFRFPNTGVLYHAAQEDGILLHESWLFSDDVDELAAGWRAGCRVGSVNAERGAAGSELHVEPQVRSKSLAGALGALLEADEFARH